MNNDFEELIRKIQITMEERGYQLYAVSNKKVFHYATLIGENPNLCCDVLILDDGQVEFKFRYLTK